MGFTFQMLQFQEERLCGAAGSLRSLDRLIDETIEYTRERKAFGKSPARQPGRALPPRRTAHRGRGAARADLPRRRALRLGQGRDASSRRWPSSSAAACRARSPIPACSTGAAWASPGTTRSRAFRDSRLISIGGGADEIMLGIICKLEGTLPGKSDVNDDALDLPAFEPSPRDVDGAVLHLTLNRPETRNAMSLRMVTNCGGARRGRSGRAPPRRRAARRGRPLLRRR